MRVLSIMDESFKDIYDQAHGQWSMFPDLVVVSDRKGGWIVEKIPPWVTVARFPASSNP